MYMSHVDTLTAWSHLQLESERKTVGDVGKMSRDDFLPVCANPILGAILAELYGRLE